MLRPLFFLTLFTLIAPSPTQADVIPPDMKYVESKVLLALGKELGKAQAINPKALRFVISPVRDFRIAKEGVANYAVVEVGKPLTWDRYCSPRIYLIDDPELDLSILDKAWFDSKDRIVSKLTLNKPSLVSVGDPSESLIITYTLEKIDGQELVLSEHRQAFDKNGKPVSSKSSRSWLMMLPLLAILASLLMTLTKRRRMAEITPSKEHKAVLAKATH